MPKQKQKKLGARKGKRQRKNKKQSKKWEKYTIENDKTTREKNCPRCGPGIFLAKHKGRLYCGRCHYTEFIKE